MGNYRIYSIENRSFAIQTIYDYTASEHRIAFHEIKGS